MRLRPAAGTAALFLRLACVLGCIPCPTSHRLVLGAPRAAALSGGCLPCIALRGGGGKAGPDPQAPPSREKASGVKKRKADSGERKGGGGKALKEGPGTEVSRGGDGAVESPRKPKAKAPPKVGKKEDGGRKGGGASIKDAPTKARKEEGGREGGGGSSKKATPKAGKEDKGKKEGGASSKKATTKAGKGGGGKGGEASNSTLVRGGGGEAPVAGPLAPAQAAVRLGLTGVLFSELEGTKIRNATLKTLRDRGITYASPVQHATIPLLLNNKDVVVQAATGSGKTLAYAVPAVEMIKASKLDSFDVGVLVLLPTRELADQVVRVSLPLLKASGIQLHPLIGGGNMTSDKQIWKQSGGQYVVGTPGRVLDALQGPKSYLPVRSLLLLVLDEADRLLALGFEAAISKILGSLPKQRRTGLFSATMGTSVRNLVRAGLRNPRSITVSVATKDGKHQNTPVELENWWMSVTELNRYSVLLEILKRERGGKVLVFTLTCGCVDYVSKLLESVLKDTGRTVRGMHGQMVQKRREKTLEAFEESSEGVLVCTDVAARGLDLSSISTVIQLEPPQDVASYVHRIGRAGRMGKAGKSILMLMPSERRYLELLKSVGGVDVKPMKIDGIPDLTESLRDAVRSDRAVFDASMKAMASWVRAYQLTSAPAILPLSGINLAQLAQGMGLLHLPVMPELLKSGAEISRGVVRMEGFTTDKTRPDDIQFKDRLREAARKRRLVLRDEERWAAAARGRPAGTSIPLGAPKAGPWSKKMRKLERKRKRRLKGAGGKETAVPGAVRSAPHDSDESEGELEQLRKDAALVAKMKRMGKKGSEKREEAERMLEE